MRIVCILHATLCFAIIAITTELASSAPGVQAVTFVMRKVAFSCNQFGIDLYRALNVSDSNVALCPFCIASSLAMILLGAEANTAIDLRQALYLWGMHPQDIHMAFHDLIAHLGQNLHGPPDDHHQNSGGVYARRGFGSAYGVPLKQRDLPVDDNVFKIINNIYIQRHFAVRYPYHFYLHRNYNTTVHPMDFVTNAEESTKHINAVFRRFADGKISNILTHIPSSSTNLLLFNALVYEGTLDLNMTRIEDGRSWSSDDSPPVMLEARRARVRYGVHDYLNCTAVEMPFKGGLISLVALLPNDPASMNLLETRLSAQRLTDIINTMQVKRVNFQMPRISISQTHGNLTKALFRLGLVDLFTPGYANLFGISNFGWLHVTNITHASVVEVKEAFNSGFLSHQQQQASDRDDITEVSLDKPFLWFIMDNIAGLAIAMGKMVKPESDLHYHNQHPRT